MTSLKKPKFYVTTAIDYPSSAPHLGHAYEKTVADVMARWHRLKGEDVFFLTGTDEHGMKIERAAANAGMKPRQFVDMQAAKFRELCRAWNISQDRFIRTTENGHEKLCRKIFMKVLEKGDIYLGKYEGLYCTDCERFYLEKDLQEGNCPVHGKAAERVKEPSYFFRMGRYHKQLMDYFSENPSFICPHSKRQEIVNRLKEGLLDLSVSRASFDWGIPLPNDPEHVIYVWFDALLNYVSGISYGRGTFEKYWPADVHNIGKDILWFHSVIWPCILFAAGLQPPKRIWVHGFINTETGEKMSKSRGNIIDPFQLARDFNVDAVRYFLLREIPFGEDGFFSMKGLAARNNNELANELGNLLNRTLVLIEKSRSSRIPKAKFDPKLAEKLDLEKIKGLMDKNEFPSALAEIFSFISECNRYINEKQPWKLKGKELDCVLYTLADALRVTAVLLSPFMPASAEKMNSQLGTKLGLLKDCSFGLLKAGTAVKRGEILFSKIEWKEPEHRARWLSFLVDKKLSSLGMKIAAAVVEGVKVKKKHSGLERLKKGAVSKIDLAALEKGPVRGYFELYDALGVKRDAHAIMSLADVVKKAGKLPTINTAVDAYNLVSLSKGLIVGAHDLGRVEGNVSAGIAEQPMNYIPLGSEKPALVERGEYYFADEGGVICRMDMKQCHRTRITEATKNLFIYVQGNSRTTQKEVEQALEETLGNIVKYCGGKARHVKVAGQ